MENLLEIFSAEFADNFNSKVSSLIKSIKYPPCYTVVRVNTLRISTADVLSVLEQFLNEQYEHKNCPPPSIHLHPKLKDVIIIKSSGIQTNCEPKGKEVIVGLQCGASVLRGADVFAPGIMGAPQGMHQGDVVAVYADINGLCRKGQTDTFMGEKLFLGNGTACVSRQDLFKGAGMAKGVGIKMIEPIFDCPSIGDHQQGLLFLQNLPSVVCGHVLDPKPGETVLDMCAAPGGKTTHLGTLMKNQGLLIALDKSAPKISKIRSNATKLGITCIESYVCDATKCIDESASGNDSTSPPFLPNTFDRVLLDAPCSCLGQRPILTDNVTAADVSSFQYLQRKLLKTAEKLVKIGGTLVYSTCTLTVSENEENVAWALQSFPSLSLDQQVPYLGSPGCKTAKVYLSDDQLSLLQRFDYMLTDEKKSPDDDTIGFFIAKFKKS